MLKLPKVNKSVHRKSAFVEKTKKAIVGVALAMGLAFVSVPAPEAKSATVPSIQQQIGGSLLLAVPVQTQGTLTGHYSHSSHSSHSSHHSHYSSRY